MLMSWTKKLRSATRAAWWIWVELWMKKDETAYLAPDNTIFKAPLRDSLEPSPFPNPLLSAWLHDLDLLQIDQIICFMLVIQFTLTPLLAGLYAVQSLTPLWRANSLRWIAARSTRRILSVAWTKAEAVYFDTSYMEASMSEARDKRNGVLNPAERMMWGKRRATKINPICRCIEDVGHPECMSIGYVFMFAILMWPFS